MEIDRRQIDAVVSLHLNAHTCGVARFNANLAEMIGVPMVGIDQVENFQDPLISIKTSEFDSNSLDFLATRLGKRFGLILHGFDGTDLELKLVADASYVMVLNSESLSQVRPFRPDCLLGFAPGLAPTEMDDKVDVTLITFGMAHKINAYGYRMVADLISRDSRVFRLEISSALHEGTTFDDRFFSVKDEISEVFARNVKFLGFLADGEVGSRLRTADAMLAFFPRGARENNTSIIGAMAHGLPVITNLDGFSPSWMIHGETVFDVVQMDCFPSKQDLSRVGLAGKHAVAGLTYEELSARLLGG